MVSFSAISYCKATFNRNIRQAIAVLVAYGVATHHILVAFAVTAMALGMQGQGDSIFMGSASTRQLIMVLCRPSTLWTDSADTVPQKSGMPDNAHLQGCCGISAVQSAGLMDAPQDFTALPQYSQVADIRWYLGQAVWPDSYRFAPAARGPPVS